MSKFPQKPKVVAAITARMGSTRLPGKVLAELAGHPLLWHMVERLRRCRTVDETVVAIPESKENEQLVKVAGEMGIRTVEGAEEDVLARLLKAAEETQADVLIRICGDCPLIDPHLLDRLVEALITHQGDKATLADRTNTLYPGIDVASTEALRRLDRILTDHELRQHASSMIIKYPEQFRIVRLEDDRPALKREGLRLTVDNRADLRFMRAIYDALYQPGEIIDIAEVVKFLDEHPDIRAINAHVAQKGISERSYRVAIWIDAGERVGLGHARRAIALGEILQERHHCGVWLAGPSAPSIQEFVQKQLFPYVPLESSGTKQAGSVAKRARELRWDSLVVDLPHALGSPELALLKHDIESICIIDTIDGASLEADLVILPVVHVSREKLERSGWKENSGRHLGGAEFVVLSSEYATIPPRMQIPLEKEHILVTMGGADPAGLTVPCTQALLTLEGNNPIDVVIGIANQKRCTIEKEFLSLRGRVNLHQHVDSLLPLMDEATLAISSFGVTAYELAARGVPAILIPHKDEDVEACKNFCQFGTALYYDGSGEFRRAEFVNLVSRLLTDEDLRKQMGTKGKELVDGRGAERSAQAIMTTFKTRKHTRR